MSAGQLFRQNLAYMLVAILAVGAAFLISIGFTGHLRAQEPPPPAAQAAPVPTSQNPAPSVQDPAAPGAEALPAPPGGADPQNLSATKGQPSNAIDQLEGFLEPFIYDQVNRRDPFQPYAEYTPQDVNQPSRPLSPAQRFDLDQLHLVGVMWDVKDPKAMFMDPENEVLILGRDEGIGNHNGYIASIREGEVVVVEALRRHGDIVYKTRVLKLER